ncbi:hypothetical protein HY637_02245 [Candidatus Woesearchaeota archaeon]|nr:hypothetical protein [Candidatus Woesearchaeota archaeon]
MAHITLSVPDELYEEMKKHPEIKWSEAARQGIRQQMSYTMGVVSGKELLSRLSPDARAALERISNLPKGVLRKQYNKMKESEKRRMKLLTRTSS